MKRPWPTPRRGRRRSASTPMPKPAARRHSAAPGSKPISAAKLADAEKQIVEKKSAAMANVDSIASEATHAIMQQLTGKPAEADAVAAALAAAKA